MFVRCKKRFKDGKEHRYWSVVENVRVSGGRVVITHAYLEVVKRKVVTFDFARLMEGASEVSTSAFAGAITEQICKRRCEE